MGKEDLRRLAKAYEMYRPKYTLPILRPAPTRAR